MTARTKVTWGGALALRRSLVPIDSLEPFPGNPRRGDVDKLASSLQRFGQVRPVLVDGARIIAGHHVVEAARQLDWSHVAVVQNEFANEDEQRAYLLADNRLSELGTIDEEALAVQLAALAAGYDGTGYTARDRANLEKRLKALRPAAPLDDDVELTPPEEPKSVRGEVYELGPHRLMCGDCTQPLDIEKLTDGRDVELILTDPPYCSGGFQEVGRSAGSVGTSAVHKQIANDRLSTRGYIALMKAALAFPCPYVYVFTDWRMWVYLFDVVESSGFGVRSMIVWDKGTPGMGRGWRMQHELIMWGAKETPPFDKHAPGKGNVLSATRTGNVLHTTQKPATLLVSLLEAVPFVEHVYDPFAGSGSTLIACDALDRHCLAMELDPGYCDVIRQRYADYAERPDLAP